MILDTMENAKLYAGTVPGLEKMLEALRTHPERAHEGTREEICGSALFINDCNYETSPMTADSLLEAHRAYIDVMYMLKGEEKIYVKPTDRLTTVTQAYDPAGDALLAKADGDETAVALREGMFVVLFPQDAHAPAHCFEGAEKVHKLIGKLAVDFK